MTEEKARKAKRLIEELDNVRRLPENIRRQYQMAINDGDRQAIEKLANVAHELAQ